MTTTIDFTLCLIFGFFLAVIAVVSIKREKRGIAATLARENAKLTAALERIALLDEADGHELKQRHAFEAVSIASNTLGKHPSQIFSERHNAR